MADEIFVSPNKKGRIAVFLSGRGSNFRAILEAADAGKINASIALVFSNVESAPGLLFARERGAISQSQFPHLGESGHALQHGFLRSLLSFRGPQGRGISATASRRVIYSGDSSLRSE